MCPECHRFICEESCPHSGRFGALRGRVHLFCSRCREPIAGGAEFYSVGTRAFCAECLEDADQSELAAIFKYPSHAALLETLGAAVRVAFGEEGCL